MKVYRSLPASAILGLVLIGAGVSFSMRAADPPGPVPTEEQLQRVLTERHASAEKAFRLERIKLENGRSTLEMVCLAARRVRDAELDLKTRPEERVTVLSRHLATMRQLEQQARKRVETGTLAPGDEEVPRYWRLTAEAELLRAQREAGAAK